MIIILKEKKTQANILKYFCIYHRMKTSFDHKLTLWSRKKKYFRYFEISQYGSMIRFQNILEFKILACESIRKSVNTFILHVFVLKNLNKNKILSVLMIHPALSLFVIISLKTQNTRIMLSRKRVRKKNTLYFLAFNVNWLDDKYYNEKKNITELCIFKFIAF